MTFTDEVVVPFTAPLSALPRVTRCRSTLLVSSLLALREHGLFPRYEKRLAHEHKDTLLTCVAGAWLPIDAAIAHYEACDSLGLAPGDQARMGGVVAERMHRSMLNTIVRLASGVGVTPWTGLAHFHRFYDRVFDGGGARVLKTGPKDARIDVVGLPLARIPYFVHAYRGMIQANAQLFSARAFVRAVPSAPGGTSITFRLAWA